MSPLAKFALAGGAAAVACLALFIAPAPFGRRDGGGATAFPVNAANGAETVDRDPLAPAPSLGELRTTAPLHAAEESLPGGGVQAQGILELHVFSPTGAPAGGAFVELSSYPASAEEKPPAPQVLLVEGDGVLRLLVPLGEVDVSAWTDSATAGPVRCKIPTTDPVSLEMRLEFAVTVEGRVLDALTLLPIPDAEVWNTTFSSLDRIKTDGYGYYRLTRFPVDGRGHFLGCGAAGHGMESKGLTVYRDGKWRIDVPGRQRSDSLAPAEFGTGLPVRMDFELPPALSITGRVVDPLGEPVPGAKVQAQGHFWVAEGLATPDEAEGTTDAAGRFGLPSLRSDLTHTVTIDAPGFGLRRFLTPASQEPVVDVGVVHLARELELLVTVATVDGLPVEGAAVLLVNPELLPKEAPPPGKDVQPSRDADVRVYARQRGTTGPIGQAWFGRLSPGQIRLEISVDAMPAATEEVELRSATTTNEVTINLPAAYVAIEGVVLLNGNPVANANVCVEGRIQRYTTSGPDGKFLLAGNDAAIPLRTLRATWTAGDGREWFSEDVEFELDVPSPVRLLLIEPRD